MITRPLVYLEYVLYPSNDCSEVEHVSQNEDCGQMSAWFIFSALGFYPVNPASGEYIVGSYVKPIFRSHR